MISTTVVGAVIAILLSVNAFFIRELVKTITEMRLELVKMITQHDNTVADVKDNKNRILKLEDRVHELELRVRKQK